MGFFETNGADIADIIGRRLVGVDVSGGDVDSGADLKFYSQTGHDYYRVNDRRPRHAANAHRIFSGIDAQYSYLDRMNVTEDQLLAYLASFVWPFFRVSSMFISIPVFSIGSVPATLRIAVSLLITFVLLPALPPMPQFALFSFQGWIVTLQQIALGVTAGFILQMVFSIMLFSGQTIAYSMGLGFASMVDPATGVQVPVIAQLFVIATSLLFLAVDGHLLLIEMMAQSFTTLPVAMVGLDKAGLWQVVSWSSQIFAGGLLLALPIMTTLLFVNISFGIASKAAPQLHLFGVGFPITILMGMVLIWISLSGMLEGFADMLHESFSYVSQMLRLS